MITWSGVLFIFVSFFFFLSFPFPRCSVQQFLLGYSPPTPLHPPSLFPCSLLSLCIFSTARFASSLYFKGEWCGSLFMASVTCRTHSSSDWNYCSLSLADFYLSPPVVFSENKCFLDNVAETLSATPFCWIFQEATKKRSSEWAACLSGRFHRWGRAATATVPAAAAAKKPINTSIIMRLRQPQHNNHRRQPTKIKLAIQGKFWFA